MTSTRSSLLLITGIPGSGKTFFGNVLSEKLGFHHVNLEDQAVLNQWSENPAKFVETLVSQKRKTVVTWGFVPDDAASVESVQYFRRLGFKLVWFDGNRPASLREFLKRGDIPEISFYIQMYKIEHSQIILRISPSIVNPFDDRGKFKLTGDLLQEVVLA